MNNRFDRPETAESRARSRTQLIRHLGVHGFIYVLVNGGNLVISRVKDIPMERALWLAAAWGAALCIHLLNLIDFDLLTSDRRAYRDK